MIEQFTPSWVNYLDEPMSTWTNKYSCPGWMFMPRKPWPFRNEYHTVCCSLSGILWKVELVEGKDSPSQNAPKINNEGKMVRLLFSILEPIFDKGIVVVLDSGFCVLSGIIELKKYGVYASNLIKKRKYWPKHIKGEGERPILMVRLGCQRLCLMEGNDGRSALSCIAMKEPTM